jgi:hypothetical protein
MIEMYRISNVNVEVIVTTEEESGEIRHPPGQLGEPKAERFSDLGVSLTR